jgi:uncharacterized membrane protein YqjE
MTSEGEAGVGLIDALRKAAATGLSILQSRLELATLELSVSLRHVLAAIFMGVAGALLMVFGFVALSAGLVVLLWGQLGVGGLFLLGLLYFGVGVGLALKVRNDLRAQAPLLQATNAELHRDATMLRGHSSHAAPVEHQPPAH